MTITVTGSGFAGGATVRVLDAGGTEVAGAVSPGSLVISSDTSLSFTLATGLTAGTYTVRVMDSNNQTADATLTIVSPSASLNPNSVNVGYAQTTVAVTGTGTSFGSGTVATLLDAAGQDTGKVSNWNATSTTQATFTLLTGLAAGSYTLRLVSGSETVTAAFTVNTPSISLSTASVNVGYGSQTITVTGTNTDFDSSTTVTVDGSSTKVSGVTVASATSLSFTLATGLAAGAHTVQVSTSRAGGTQTASATFTVNAPSIALNPAALDVGYASQTITVTGTNTDFDAATTVTVSGGGSATNVQVASATTLTFTLGSGLGAGTYTVTVSTNRTGGTQTASATLSVNAVSRSITLTPNSVNVGYSQTTITVTGTNTNFSNASQVTVLDNQGQDTTKGGAWTYGGTATSGSFPLLTGLSAGTYTVRITTGSEVVEGTLAVAAPSISLSTPSLNVGYASQTITVTGSNTNFTDATPSVKIDGSSAKVSGVTVASATSLSFTLATGLAAGAHAVEVSTPRAGGTQTATATLTVNAPTISISPSQLPAGYADQTTIMVTGTNTNFTEATPSVSVAPGGTVTGVTVTSDTGLTFRLGSGLAMGNYTVTVTTARAGGNQTATAALAVTGGITVAATGASTAVAEGGATDTFTVALTSQPTAAVTVAVYGDSQVEVSSDGTNFGPTASLTFTTANWNTPQTVTVRAIDDAIAEGAHTGTVTHAVSSADSNFNGLTVSNVTVNVADNDTAGVTVSRTSVSVTEGGATDTFTVALTSQPTAAVTVAVYGDSQVTVTPGTLTFTSANWSAPQTVTVTAVDDAVYEGFHTGTVSFSVASADAGYNAMAVNALTANITDNDIPSGGTITGVVQLQGRAGGNWAGISVKVIGQAISTTTAADGSFTLTGIPAGTVDLLIRYAKYLAARVNGVVIDSGQVNAITTVVLKGGDANSDNVVNATDFSMLAASYRRSSGQTGFNANADFNGDGSVNSTDFGILAANYRQSGATIPVGE